MKKVLFFFVAFLFCSHMWAQSEAIISKNNGGNTSLKFSNNNDNILIGINSGSALTNGTGNVLLGNYTGLALTDGSLNTFVGMGAGNVNGGYSNVALGYNAAQSSTGNGNVFLGNTAGFTAGDKNNSLWIANSIGDSTQALIYGEFDSDYLRLNAKVNVSDDLLIEQNHGIGVGIVDPLFPLDIELPSSRIKVKSTDDLNDFAGILTESNTRQFFIGTQGTFETSNPTSGFQIYDNTASAQRFVIDETGNVGIAVSQPTAKLEVQAENGSYGIHSKGKVKITPNSADSEVVKVEDENGATALLVKADGTTVIKDLELEADGLTFDNGNTVKKAVQMRYFISLNGLYPSFSGGTNEGTLIGEIKLVPYTGDLSGWQECDGTLLSIANNAALFSLIGNTYGGDGMTTFAVPDMREAIPYHAN